MASPPVTGAPTASLTAPAADKPPPEATAPPFDAPRADVEAPPPPPADPATAAGPPPFKPYKRVTRVNWVGCAVLVAYLAALAFYLWVRITKTLNLGAYTWYGGLVLAVEILGATTVLLYGTNLVITPAPPPPPKLDEATGAILVEDAYHVRVVVPCYKESLDILRRTITAAREAALPPGCARTVYLCDDGRDPKKRKWVDALADPAIVYVSGRKRPAGETNGKSGNINNLLKQLYGATEGRVPGREVVCVFDADQVASKEFFLKTLPLFDGGDDVAMVLSPQCFHNINPHADIFNHSNVHFWEYMQPGYDALGFISCTGTNFLVRARALLEVGGSPTWTLTEDFALGMELKRKGWHCRYVAEYLAIGEAPDAVRNCYQQRSRWCKGHFQIFFSAAHCPLLQKGLSPFMRILYCSGVWNYWVGGLSTPFFFAVPIVTIWGGVFPIVVSWWAALGLSVYYTATNAVLYYVRSLKHVEALYFANVCNSVMWWTYLKASIRALASAMGAGGITFKTTLKGASAFMDGAIRDLWLPGLTFAGLAASAVAGAVKLFQGPTLASPLAISVLWAVYGAIPPFLVLFYAAVSRGAPLAILCRLAMLASFAAGGLAVFLMWGLYPARYAYGDAVAASLFSLDGQRVGAWPAPPADAPPPPPAAPWLGVPSWRGDALLQEATSGPGGGDLTGGWLAGGAAGNGKVTSTIAFTTALAAWSLIQFPESYAAADAATPDRAADAVRWGADYLMKASGGGAGLNGTVLVAQVGNWTADRLWWGRPEDIGGPRPAFAVGVAAGAADLAGATAGALAAASVAWRPRDPAYADELVARAAALFEEAAVAPGFWWEQADGGQPYSPFAPEGKMTTMYDKMLWAAGWLYRATADDAYLLSAANSFVRYLYEEGGGSRVAFSPDAYFTAAAVLLANATDGGTYHERARAGLRAWACADGTSIKYTPRGRAVNHDDPTLGGTAAAAFLAGAYGHTIRYWQPRRASRYACWGLAQTRYALGDAGRSLVVGLGTDPPLAAANQAASCPPAPAACDAVTAQLTPAPNPFVLYGALVEGPGWTDRYVDARPVNGSRVTPQASAALGAAAAAALASPTEWEACLQGFGVLSKDRILCAGSDFS